MGSIKDEAQAYEPKQTLNIADLDTVELDFALLNGEGIDQDGKPFKYKYFVKDDKEYRVPSSVLGEIKKIIKLKPEIKKVKVTKHGTGLSTRYEVDPVV